MDPVMTGVQLGRQFWVSGTTENLRDAIGIQGTAPTQTAQVDLNPPDKSFVNFVHGGKGGQFAPAVNAAKIEACHQRSISGGTPATDEATAKTNLMELTGSDDLDAYVDDLAGRILHNENSYFNGRDEGEAKALLKKSLVAFLNLSEVNDLRNANLANGRDADWNNQDVAESRLLAIDNAVLGIAELLDSNEVDESTVLYMKDKMVLSVNNYEDLAEIMSTTAKTAQKTFVNQSELDDLKASVQQYTDQTIKDLKRQDANGLNVKGVKSGFKLEDKVKQVNDAKAAIDKAIADVLKAREDASKLMKTEVRTKDANGRALSEKELRAELQKVSNSTRTFRYSMDQHVKRSGQGFGMKVRRFFSNLFFNDKASKVSDQAFKAVTDAEAKLKSLLEDFHHVGGAGHGREPLSFADVKQVSKESGDLTHIANSLLRNCSKKTDRSYVAYMNRAHELFDDTLNAPSNSTTGVKTLKLTCKLGAELAFDFGIGTGKGGADVKREVEVLLHPGGAVSMRLAKGANVHGGVQVGYAGAEAKAEYMQGRVLTYDSFDKFVAAAYGKLALPVTKDERNQRVDGTLALKGRDVKFLGDTSGNAAKRMFRSMGFLEFGTRVDTEFFLKSLNSKGIVLTTTALIDGLDPNQGHVASAKEKKLSGAVSAGIKYASEDETKNFDFGVGVEGVLWKRTNDVETVNVFDLTAQMTPDEINEAFEKQLGSVKDNVVKADKLIDEKSFLNRTRLGRNFGDEIKKIVAQAKDGSLTLAKASEMIRDTVGNLQWQASAHSPGKKSEEYWTDYARCLRACTLAQSVIETLVADPANAEAGEIYSRTEEIQRMAHGLRAEMPDKVYDTKVMYGVTTREEPWHAAARLTLSGGLDIEGDDTVNSSKDGRTGQANRSGQGEKGVDLEFDGTVTWFEMKKDEVPDKYRPWATAPGRYVDINLQDGEMSEKLLDKIVEKALPNGPDSDRTTLKSDLTTLLTNAGVKVEGSTGTTGTARPKGAVSVRLEYDRNDGEKKLVRLSASSKKVTTQSQSVGKGPLKINLSRELDDTSELTSLFLNPSLSRIMGDVENLSKGSLSEYPSPALESYANRNHEVVEKLCEGLTRPDSESGKMLSQMKGLLPAMKAHPAYKGWASAFETRLSQLETHIAQYGSHSGDAGWKVEHGTEFLLLATQTMRLVSMFENDPMQDRNVFVV